MRSKEPKVPRELVFPILVAATIILGSCKSFEPVPLEIPSALGDVQTKRVGDVTLSVAILTDEEACGHFGVDLGAHGIQAMWMRVRNASPYKLWFIRNIVDPDLYSADEVALLVEAEVPGSALERVSQYLRDESIRVLMQPGHITEGFVFLPKVEGGRYVDIRLSEDAFDKTQRTQGAESETTRESGNCGELRFGFALPMPDGDFDYEYLDASRIYPEKELPNLDTNALRAALEQLPCCTTDADGELDGDPLNLVLVGESVDVLNALSRAGWAFTHRITLRSIRRLIDAAISGGSYPVAPVSSLYVFGRKQDFALQRSRQSISQRNHLRLWLAPFRYEERQVWIGQISRDIGIKITLKSSTLTTHIIDPEVDLTREYVLHSLLAVGLVERFGFVKGSKTATRTQPAYNLTDDPYFSDGMRVVIVLSVDPIPYHEVRNLLWERSASPVAEGQTESAGKKVRPIEPADPKTP